MQTELTSFFSVAIAGDGGGRGTSFAAVRASEVAVDLAPRYFSQGGVTEVLPVRQAARATRLRVELAVGEGQPAVLAEWWADVIDAGKPLPKRVVDISQLDAEGNRLRTWRLKGAWPCKVGLAPIGHSESSDRLIEYYEFVFEDFEDSEAPKKQESKPAAKKAALAPGPQEPTPEQTAAYHEIAAQIETADVSTKYGKAVLYSGYRTETAKKLAEEEGRTSLEMTPGGKWLDEKKLFRQDSPVTQDQAKALWGRLSERYAEQVSGPVTVHERVRDGGEMARSIFRTKELPALEKNKNVHGLRHFIDFGTQ